MVFSSANESWILNASRSRRISNNLYFQPRTLLRSRDWSSRRSLRSPISVLPKRRPQNCANLFLCHRLETPIDSGGHYLCSALVVGLTTSTPTSSVVPATRRCLNPEARKNRPLLQDRLNNHIHIQRPALVSNSGRRRAIIHTLSTRDTNLSSTVTPIRCPRSKVAPVDAQSLLWF